MLQNMKIVGCLNHVYWLSGQLIGDSELLSRNVCIWFKNHHYQWSAISWCPADVLFTLLPLMYDENIDTELQFISSLTELQLACSNTQIHNGRKAFEQI